MRAASDGAGDEVTIQARLLAWEGLYNARDLGGHPTPSGATRFGRAVRCESLELLSPAGLGSLRQFPIATVVDLRSPREQRAEMGPLAGDPGYRHRPVLEDADMDAVARLTSTEDLYRYFLENRARALAGALSAIAGSAWPVLIHCKAGKDRTGVVVALLLANAGVEPESIAADYALSDTMLAPLYERWAREAGADPQRATEQMRRYSSKPEAMRRLLELVERRHGGVREYLLRAGMDEGELAALRSLLLD